MIKDGSLPGADPELRGKPSLQTFRRLLLLSFSTRAQNIGRGIHERLQQVVTDLSPPRHEKSNRWKCRRETDKAGLAGALLRSLPRRLTGEDLSVVNYTVQVVVDTVAAGRVAEGAFDDT